MRGAGLVDSDGSPHSAPDVLREPSTARPGRADLVAIVGLVVFPTLLYALPALFGRPLIPGDDLYQNYPLRVLAGDLLSHGHMPAWNPWIWSGTPLLGGFNAGALYPGTLLFAALNPLAAWVLNEIAVFAVCGVGLYLLFRNHRLVPLAAAIGAVSFTFAGFMQAHLVHFGLIQGMSWAPWLLLAIDHLAAGSTRRLGWWVVLGVSGGLVILSGEPRAMANVAVVVLVYGVFVLWRSPYRNQLLAAIGSAALFAFALGAVQLLPGLDFLAVSQRGHVGFSWYTVGSLRFSQLTLSVVPYLIGGYNDLRLLPSFAGRGSNLDEITGYVGLLALVVLFTIPFWIRAKYDARVCMGRDGRGRPAPGARRQHTPRKAARARSALRPPEAPEPEPRHRRSRSRGARCVLGRRGALGEAYVPTTSAQNPRANLRARYRRSSSSPSS